MNKVYVKIIEFDDGRCKYKIYPNKWLISATKFNGGKLVLKNAFDDKIIINTISSWKTEPYED